MIKKLRRKFIIVSVLSVFLLLTGILVTVNVINYTRVADDADKITQILVDNNGSFFPSGVIPGIIPNQDENKDDQTRPFERGGDRKEAPYDIRYFYVKYDKDGNAVETNVTNTITFSEDQAIRLTTPLLAKKAKTGWNGNYRYRVQTKDEYTYVILIDYNRELSPSRTVTWTSLIIGVSGLIIATVIIYFISNIVVKPVYNAFKKQKEFISNASHELKTPITVISANNEILEIEYGSNDSIETIHRQINKLSNIVKDLNSLAKIDEYERLSVYTSFNLSDIVNDISDSFKELFTKDNKEFITDIDNDITYKGDENLIRNLVSIILENSYKYSVSKANISLKKDNDKIVIETINDADSVKDGDINEVFERFYRSDEARASNIEGSGIGLSMAKEIVDIHKGKIKARGENNNFILRIEL